MRPLGRAVDEVGDHVQLAAQRGVVVAGDDADGDRLRRQADDEFGVASPHLLLLPLGAGGDEHPLGVDGEAHLAWQQFGGALLVVEDGHGREVAVIDGRAGRVQRQAGHVDAGDGRVRRQLVHRPPEEKALVEQKGAAEDEQDDQQDAADDL